MEHRYLREFLREADAPCVASAQCDVPGNVTPNRYASDDPLDYVWNPRVEDPMSSSLEMDTFDGERVRFETVSDRGVMGKLPVSLSNGCNADDSSWERCGEPLVRAVKDGLVVRNLKLIVRIGELVVEERRYSSVLGVLLDLSNVGERLQAVVGVYRKVLSGRKILRNVGVCFSGVYNVPVESLSFMPLQTGMALIRADGLTGFLVQYGTKGGRRISYDIRTAPTQNSSKGVERAKGVKWRRGNVKDYVGIWYSFASNTSA